MVQAIAWRALPARWQRQRRWPDQPDQVRTGWLLSAKLRAAQRRAPAQLPARVVVLVLAVILGVPQEHYAQQALAGSPGRSPRATDNTRSTSLRLRRGGGPSARADVRCTAPESLPQHSTTMQYVRRPWSVSQKYPRSTRGQAAHAGYSAPIGRSRNGAGKSSPRRR